MNDAGLGELIQDDAEMVESYLEREKMFVNDDAHLHPSRWWFASSAFPMIAGTLGPVASAFSICALVRPWRQRLMPGEVPSGASFIDDPVWLTIINAIQLALALVSNMFLLLNMTRRVRFSIAQPITIIGWYISVICLVALTATAPGPLDDDLSFPIEQLIWSQAYFYGIWAAILYFFVASLMAVTFYGASTGHYSKDFVLTRSQRTLMLQTILFLMYLLLGALIFSNIEGWNYLDSVYWADVTLFTVGFGDFHAKTTLGRALMIPYSLIGVISLGLVIGSIRSLVLDRGKRHVDARMEEKKRRKLVKRIIRRGDDLILEPIRSESGLSQNDRPGKVPNTEFERRKAEFELMRQIQTQASIRRRWMAMAISTGSWLILWLLGAFIFVKCEKSYQGWTYFDGFYFCFVALTTIGYGDVTPVSNAGKSFFVFWSLLALPTMTVLISNAGDTVVKFVRDSTLRVGNVTILPGDTKFSNDVRHILNKLMFGKFCPGHEESPESKEGKSIASAMASVQRSLFKPASNSEDPGPYDNDRGRSVQSNSSDVGASRHSLARSEGARSNFTTKVRRSLSRIRDPLNELPSGTDLHFLLISEIQVVSKHLKAKKPHHYTFDQWAWYLKLIGEDESSAETHRKVKPKPKSKKRPKQKNAEGPDLEQEETEDNPASWSWVGNRSPLIGSQEESEWILDRLMDRLRESLAVTRRHEVKLATGAIYDETHHLTDSSHEGGRHRIGTHHTEKHNNHDDAMTHCGDDHTVHSTYGSEETKEL